MSLSAAATRVRGIPHLGASLALLVTALVLYVTTASYDFYQTVSDATYTSSPAWALAQNHSLNLEVLPKSAIWGFPVGDHVRSDRFPGAILFATPFYWFAGSADFSVGPGAVSAAVATALAVVVFHRTLLTLVRPTTALAACAVVAFATPFWTVAGHSAWTHGPSLLGLSVGAWAMTKHWYAAAGLGYAFAILSRPHTAVVPAVVGLWESVSTRSLRPAVSIGLTSVLGVLALLLWNRVNANEWSLLVGSYSGRADAAVTTGGTGQAKGQLWLNDVTGMLVSPLRGILVFSPFLLLLLPGLAGAWRVSPAWVRSSAVGGGVFLVVQLSGNTWTGGLGFFGYRLPLEALFLAAPLLALSRQGLHQRGLAALELRRAGRRQRLVVHDGRAVLRGRPAEGLHLQGLGRHACGTPSRRQRRDRGSDLRRRAGLDPAVVRAQPRRR